MARVKYEPGPQPPVRLGDKIALGIMVVLSAALFTIFFWIGRHL